jgi:hypothetical protein
VCREAGVFRKSGGQKDEVVRARKSGAGLRAVTERKVSPNALPGPDR